MLIEDVRNNLNEIYEINRLTVMSIQKSLVKSGELETPTLRNRITEFIHTVENDALILNDYLIELSGCTDESELVFLTEINESIQELSS